MSELRIIRMKDKAEWDRIVTSFRQYDVYYLSNYAKGFCIHGDGDPLLVYYENNGLKGMSVSMKRDISNFSPFFEIISPDTWFDLTTPYGYGGFLFEGEVTESAIRQFATDYVSFLQSEHIVSDFVRYHPLLGNAEPLRSVSEVVDLGMTVAINLESPQLIWTNFTPQNRNNIRKAQNADIEIRHGKSWSLFAEFKKIYDTTMQNDHADSYYYFQEPFYKSIHEDLADNYEMFYAVLDDKIIAMVIMLYANKQMHAHFAGSLCRYRNLQPSNLLFYEAARWGSAQGFKTLHLGGGVCCEEDNLFRFKQSFNRRSANQFSVGRNIVNKDMYDYLVALRKDGEFNFHMDSAYFPLYRYANGNCNCYNKYHICTCMEQAVMQK